MAIVELNADQYAVLEEIRINPGTETQMEERMRQLYQNRISMSPAWSVIVNLERYIQRTLISIHWLANKNLIEIFEDNVYRITLMGHAAQTDFKLSIAERARDKQRCLDDVNNRPNMLESCLNKEEAVFTIMEKREAHLHKALQLIADADTTENTVKALVDTAVKALKDLDEMIG